MSKRGRFSAVMSQRAFLYRPPACAIRQESDSASERRDSRCARLAPDSGAANDDASNLFGLLSSGGRQRLNDRDICHEGLRQTMPLFQVFRTVVGDPDLSLRIFRNQNL